MICERDIDTHNYQKSISITIKYNIKKYNFEEKFPHCFVSVYPSLQHTK